MPALIEIEKRWNVLKTPLFNLINNRRTAVQNYIDSKAFQKMVRSWGATLVGFGDVKEGLAGEFKHIPVAISLAVAHPSVKESLVARDSVIAYTNQFPAIDEAIEKIQKKIVSFLRSSGWMAFAIPPDTDKRDLSFAAKLFLLFPHKTAATCSGLGWIGKNGLLITREYGARLSWGTVLTNAPLDVSNNPYLKGECNGCNRCVEACPTGAILGTQWSRESLEIPMLDADRCRQQLAYHEKVIGKMICAHCIVACPVGRSKKLYIHKNSR